MSWLLDTNLLLRYADTTAPQHSKARVAIEALVGRGELVYLTSQNLIEFWAVATRPVQANGLGWTVPDTEARIRSLKRQFLYVPDSDSIFDEWLRLVSSLAIQGKKVHDARLAAVMKANGLTHLLTFNPEDFRAFRHISVVPPDDLEADS